MLRFRKYSGLYNSLLLGMVIALLACGPGLLDTNEFVSYFMPQSAYTPPDATPYFYSPTFLYSNFYDYWDMPADYKNDANLQSWENYCHVKIKDSLAALVIYSGQEDPGNPLWKVFLRNKSARNYLLLATRIMNASAAGGSLWNPTPADTPTMRHLFFAVNDSLKIIRDPFLKDRYAFQAVKLAHELHLYDSCIDLYNKYFGNRTDNNVIRYWALSRKGGALLDKGDTAQAIYIFSQVFAHCPSRRKQAYMSLRLYNIRFVPGALSFCKNNQEKINVYTLCAIQPWQDALPLMEQMVKINPNASYLELIMSREINKNENYYFATRYYDENPGYATDTAQMKINKATAENYFQQLATFAAGCAHNSSIKDPAFWNTASAYIQYVLGNYKDASVYLTKAESDHTGNMALKHQIILQKTLLLTGNTKQMTPELESKVLPLLDSLRNPTDFYSNNALVLACEQLASLYKNTVRFGNNSHGFFSCNRSNNSSFIKYVPTKAFLLDMLTSYQMNDSLSWGGYQANTDQFAIEDTTSDATLNNVISFFEQKNPSQDDKKFMQLTRINPNYLYFVKGRRALSIFHYADAANAWRHVADSFWKNEPFKTYLAANPFVSMMKGTHKPTKADTVKYTPYQFAVEMQHLSDDMKRNSENAAEDYYLMGCGAYNMSYYGNSWLLTKRAWSSADIPYSLRTPLPLADSLNYYSTFQAKQYFDSAMLLSGGKELAARACFMAAICEQNEYYLYCAQNERLWHAVFSGWWSFLSNGHRKDSLKQLADQIANTKFHHFFHLMKSNYSNTQFNQQALRECATYRDFAEGK